MDLRTGKTYATVEEARADGVPESDLAHVVNPVLGELRKIPKVEFSKGSFKKVLVEK